MDTKTYMDLFSRTMSKEFHGENVHPFELQDAVASRLATNQSLDDIKKSVFYNRQLGFRKADEEEASYWLDFEPDTLHAVLGIDTEAAEILELLMASPIMPTEHFKRKIIDETGDLLWYVALLLKTFDLTFEEVMEKNIEKLKARYPEGFSTDAATHRNAEKESAVFH